MGRRATDRIGGIGVEVLARAQPDDEHAAGRDRAARVQHGHLPGLAAEIAALDQLCDGTTERVVHRPRRAAGLGALE